MAAFAARDPQAIRAVIPRRESRAECGEAFAFTSAMCHVLVPINELQSVLSDIENQRNSQNKKVFFLIWNEIYFWRLYTYMYIIAASYRRIYLFIAITTKQ